MPPSETSPGPARATPNVASGALWVTIEMMFLQGLSLVTFAILAHFLTARDFGLMATAFVFVFSLKSLTVDLVTSPVTRKVRAVSIEYSTVFWICIGLGVFGCGLLQILSLFVDRIFHAPGLGAVLRPMSLVFVAFSIGRTQEAWLMRHFLFRTQAIRSIAGALLGTAIGITAAAHHFGVWSLVLQQVTTSGSALLLLYAITPWKPRLEFSRRSALEIVSFCRAISGNAVLGTINQNADVALVAAFFGPSAVGIYSVAKRLKMAIQLAAASPIAAISGPLLADAQENADQLRQVFLHAISIIFVICAPVFFGAAAVALPMIDTIFGTRWSEAAILFGWLSVGALCGITCNYLNTLLVIKDRQSSLMWFSLAQTVMAMGLFFLLSRSKLSAVAVPFVLPYIVILPIMIIFTIRLIDIHVIEWMRAIYPSLVSALLMVVAILYIQSWLPTTLPSAIKLSVLCPLGAIVYTLFITILNPSIMRDTIAVVFFRFRKNKGESLVKRPI